MRVARCVLLAAAFACLLATARGANAQGSATSDEHPVVTISEASYRSLMTRLEAVEASLAEEKARKDDGWKDTSGEKWVIKHTGRIHIDYVNYARQNAGSVAVGGDAEDFTSFRRLYYGIDGEGYGIYDFRFELDFADVNDGGINQPRIKEMYFGIKELPVLGYVRFGHFKIPQSMEVLTSSRFISLMERSMAVATFCPERELGAAATRVSADESATLSYGLFFDELDERVKQLVNDNEGATFAIRGTWTPYYDEPSKGRYLVHTGLSYKYTDDRDDTVRFRSRPEVQLGTRFIDTGNLATDNYNTLGGELAAVWGPFSVQSEAYYVPVATPAGQHDFCGAYVLGSWFLTGENRFYKRGVGAFDRLAPNSNFWVIRGAGMGPGAVELLARWSYLDLSGVSTSTLDGMQNDLTFGVNWYWNPNVKWMLNYIHSWNKYDDRAYVAQNDIFGVSARFDF